MSTSNTLAVTRHNYALLWKDPGPIIAIILMPLVMMTVIQGMGQTVLAAEGYADVNGAEHVVPGMAVLFSFFGINFFGFAYFQEHSWGTWERMRASRASTAELLAGKLIPSTSIVLAQLTLLFIAGLVFFDLNIRGSWVAFGMLIAATTALVMALSIVAVAFLRTVNQLSTTVSVAAMVLGGLGGALAPISVLPSWAQAMAPYNPAYWALEGFRGVILEGDGLAQAMPHVSVVLATALALVLVGASRFRVTDQKEWE